MSKHTPGPWATKTDTIDIYNGKTGETICECHTYGTKSKQQAFADRQLIAAAPEMLEALEEVVGWLASGSLHETDPPNQKAIAAIAKATGQD